MNGPFFPPDEFGYWANAARFVGYDWSDVASRQSTYSMGYSILLIPLMLVFENPIVLYKSAVVLNGLLFIIHAILLEAVMRLLFPKQSTKRTCILCMIGACYSSLIVYMHYTIAEMLLFVLFLAFSASFLFFLKSERTKYLLLSILFGTSLVFTHMRTLGILASFCIAMSMYLLRDRFSRDKLVKFTGLSILCMIGMVLGVIFCMKPQPLTGVQDANRLMNQLAKVYSLFHFENLLMLLTGFLGKLFYIGVATFGIGYLGMIKIVKILKNHNENHKFFFWLYFLLALFLSLVINAVYFVNGYRIDQLIYGRYSELFMPILLCLGIMELLEAKRPYRSMIIIFLAQYGVAFLLDYFISGHEIMTYMRDFIIGASWMFGRQQPGLKWVFMMPVMIEFFISILIVLIIRCSQKQGHELLLGTVAVLYIGIGVYMTSICVYDCHKADWSDLKLVNRIEEMQREGKELFFLDSMYSPYIGYVQFCLPDQRIQVTEGLSPEAFQTPEEDMVLTYPDYELPEQLSRYELVEKSEHFCLYYNY